MNAKIEGGGGEGECFFPNRDLHRYTGDEVQLGLGRYFPWTKNKL